MFFGLLNASNNFQEDINNISAKKLNVFIIVYLDDILFYTKKEGQSYIEDVH